VLTQKLVSAFLYGLDTTIAADIQAATVETFGKVQQLAWVGIGFPLGSIVTILPIGKSYGMFDVKWLFISSCVLFEIGSAVCGSAPSMDALIVGRIIAGITLLVPFRVVANVIRCWWIRNVFRSP
jgi:MFS family permease